jgi:hypothetical protein
MKNVTPENQNTISIINWEALEIYWANQYEEDYVTTPASYIINQPFLSVGFSRQFEKEKAFS